MGENDDENPKAADPAREAPLPAPATTPLADVNLLREPNGVGKSTVLDSSLHLIERSCRQSHKVGK